MTPLETTIIKQARQQLTELRSALLRPEGPDRGDDISSAFWMLNGVTILANLVDSGLSKEAAQELLAIDQEAGQAMAAARLVGVIRSDVPE